jgi:hypothetical protein
MLATAMVIVPLCCFMLTSLTVLRHAVCVIFRFDSNAGLLCWQQL